MNNPANAFRAALAAVLVLVVLVGVLAANGNNRVHLPIVRYDPIPTLPPTPPPPAFSEAANFYITPRQPINASTFNTGSFRLENHSRNGERIASLRIDFATAVFMDMVFDPYGQAGDVVAKDVVIDSRVGLSVQGHTYESPNAGGFDVLVMTFANFDPGETVFFSVDVDPTTIRGTGAPGPAESGSACGLELVGSTITVTFENGKTQTNDLTWLPEPGYLSCGGWTQLRDGTPPEVAAAVLGVVPPAGFALPTQVVRVNGEPGRPVVVTVIEGGQYLAGLPGGGYDVEPYEANSAITAREYAAAIGPGGFVDIPIGLSKNGAEGGYNMITVAAEDYYGRRGPQSPAMILKME